MITKDTTSSELFKRAKRIIPGGVNSPVRSFNSVDGNPLFIQRASGAHLWTAEGNKLIDFVGSFGPAIVGHAHPDVISSIHQACLQGLSFGAPHEGEITIVETIMKWMPHLENIRFVNSGTEACMTAIRLARGATGKNKIIKFTGCYHGHVDALLVASGSGTLQHGVPSSPGIPHDTTKDTLVCPYNDLATCRQLMSEHAADIAGIIVEPVAGNMNFILPKPGFLQGLRELCDQYQTLLIFDEVMTGFRINMGGASAAFGVIPDITTLGKVIGGGLPVGAIGGLKRWMQQLSPEGPIYQAGTLSGNPITLASGLATLKILEQQPEEHLHQVSNRIITEMATIAKQYHQPFQASCLGGMYGFFFQEHAPESFSDISQEHIQCFVPFHAHMIQRGCYFAPSAFEVCMLSHAHHSDDIDIMLSAFADFCKINNTNS